MKFAAQCSLVRRLAGSFHILKKCVGMTKEKRREEPGWATDRQTEKERNKRPTAEGTIRHPSVGCSLGNEHEGSEWSLADFPVLAVRERRRRRGTEKNERKKIEKRKGMDDHFRK